MKIRNTFLACLGASIVFPAATAPASAASLDSRFRGAVERMLMNLDEGPVAEMSDAERKELVACVNRVFAGIPDERKQYVVAAQGMAELRARFDEVALADRAKLKQQATSECA